MLPGMKPRIAIVGPGNFGRALALSLHRAAYAIDSVFAQPKSIGRARTLAKQIGAKAFSSPSDCNADLVWFCVPDSQIKGAASSWAQRIDWNGKVALHSSGVLTSDELAPLRQKGASVASAHPFMTFVASAQPSLLKVPFAVEGNARAVRMASSIIRKLGGKSYAIRKKDKAAYHAWGTFASPLLTALLAATEQVARLARVRASKVRPRMVPIILQPINNYAAFGAARSFSGPIIRGDADTICQHLCVLRNVPVAHELYLALARAAIECLPARNRKSLKQILGSRA